MLVPRRAPTKYVKNLPDFLFHDRIFCGTGDAAGPTVGDDRLFLRCDKTVVAVATRVDHTGVAGLGIGKHEEFMPEKVHLKDSFLHRHRL